MKKKILALCLVVVLVATAITGVTLAYFTDKDSATNVMTLGNINIKQNEEQFDEETGEIEDFEDNKPLMPMVDTREDKDPIVVDGYFNEKLENVVDKIVTVTNEAKEGAINQDAYVRTILAFETADVLEAGTNNVIGDAHDLYIGVLGDFDYLKNGEEFVKITVNNVEYVLAYKVYKDALAPAATTEPSLKQIFMAPTANNEISDLFGSEYTILALSQGTQTTGFESAEEALNEAFGEINADNCLTWFTATDFNA